MAILLTVKVIQINILLTLVTLNHLPKKDQGNSHTQNYLHSQSRLRLMTKATYPGWLGQINRFFWSLKTNDTIDIIKTDGSNMGILCVAVEES